jgi:hypothetical protein
MIKECKLTPFRVKFFSLNNRRQKKLVDHKILSKKFASHTKYNHVFDKKTHLGKTILLWSNAHHHSCEIWIYSFL